MLACTASQMGAVCGIASLMFCTVMVPHAWAAENAATATQSTGLRLGEGLASVSASLAFGGFGRLLREGAHRAHHSVLLV